MVNIDYGWAGVAGVLALIYELCLALIFVFEYDLYTSAGWGRLTTFNVLVIIFAMASGALAAKVVATGIHAIVLIFMVKAFNQKVKEAKEDLERRMAIGRGVEKVLVCHASVGAGHKRAAEAVAQAILEMASSVEVQVVDLMEPPMADRTFIYFYKDWYLRLVGGESIFGDLGGHCVSFFFDRANSVQDEFTGGGFLTRRITQSFLLNFLHLLYTFKPDVVVHTHFLAPQLIANLRRKHHFRMPHVTVVTDMDVHAWWYQQPTDHYFTPRELASHQLRRFGVPPQDITVSGIPIMPCFREALRVTGTLDVRARRRRLLSVMDAHLDPSLFHGDDLNPLRPLVVQMSTGKGTLEIFSNLLLLQTPILLVVVCGRQADIREQLANIPVPSQHRVALIGFTRMIHELLVVSDVIVTKPGGLITAEALACGLMMVIVDPYPGQEERNAAMLLEEGVAIWCWDAQDMQPKLDPILRSESRVTLSHYKSNSKRLAAPDAAFVVASYVLGNRPRKAMLECVSPQNWRFPSDEQERNLSLDRGERTTPKLLRRITFRDLQRREEASGSGSSEDEDATMFVDSVSFDRCLPTLGLRSYRTLEV